MYMRCSSRTTLSLLKTLSYSLLIFGLLQLSLLAQAAANVSTRTLIEPAQATVLKENMGYALLNLDVSGVAPSLSLFKLSSDTSIVQHPDYASRLNFSSRRYSPTNILLKDKKQGFYLLALAEGVYQISEVNAPYFDLPYRMSTENTRDWRFTVKPGKLNYIGSLYIAKERTSDTITAKLRNRLATDLSLIKSDLSVVLETMPLVLGAGVRDDFYQQLLSAVSKAK